MAGEAFIHENRTHCKLVGLDPKHKTALLFDNRYLPECIPACQTYLQEMYLPTNRTSVICCGYITLHNT